MPLTSDDDRSKELQAGEESERSIPLPVAIFITLLILAFICGIGYFVLKLV